MSSKSVGEKNTDIGLAAPHPSPPPTFIPGFGRVPVLVGYVICDQPDPEDNFLPKIYFLAQVCPAAP